MRRTLPLLTLLLALPLGAEETEEAASASETSEWQAVLSAVEGDVIVYAGGREDEAFPAEANMPVEPGDRIETRAGGRAELALEADSLIEIGPNSVFTIEARSGDSFDFTLGLGSIVAKIRTTFLRGRGLRVVTPTAVAAVRGTEFGVEVDADGSTAVGVFDEGQIEVTHGEQTDIEPTLLRAREETHVAVGDALQIEERDGRRFLKRRKLKRFRARVKRLKHLRRRRAQLRRTWAKLPKEKRRAMRAKMKTRFRERLKSMPKEKRRRMIQRMKRRRLNKNIQRRIRRSIQRRQQGRKRRLHEQRRRRVGEKRFERQQKRKRERIKRRMRRRHKRRRGRGRKGG